MSSLYKKRKHDFGCPICGGELDGKGVIYCRKHEIEKYKKSKINPINKRRKYVCNRK